MPTGREPDEAAALPFVVFAFAIFTRWDDADTLSFKVAQVSSRDIKLDMLDHADPAFSQEAIIGYTFAHEGCIGAINVDGDICVLFGCRCSCWLRLDRRWCSLAVGRRETVLALASAARAAWGTGCVGFSPSLAEFEERIGLR